MCGIDGSNGLLLLHGPFDMRSRCLGLMFLRATLLSSTSRAVLVALLEFGASTVAVLSFLSRFRLAAKGVLLQDLGGVHHLQKRFYW